MELLFKTEIELVEVKTISASNTYDLEKQIKEFKAQEEDKGHKLLRPTYAAFVAVVKETT